MTPLNEEWAYPLDTTLAPIVEKWILWRTQPGDIKDGPLEGLTIALAAVLGQRTPAIEAFLTAEHEQFYRSGSPHAVEARAAWADEATKALISTFRVIRPGQAKEMVA